MICVGIAIIISNYRITEIPVNTNYLFFLGLKNSEFQSLDYYPLIPRFGVYLLGMSMNTLLYKNKKSII